MGKNNFELLKIAEKYLGWNGREFCGMSSNWCNVYVCKIFKEGGDASLFYGGKMVTYCPTSIQWCRANLAQIPIYLALPMDVIYFDWNANNVPDHIGFVRERLSDQAVKTIEGNTTSRFVVAYRTRPESKVLGCYRPHFKPTDFSANKKLDVDGYFGYNSIAVMQRWLGVTPDAILGKGTVKALQKRLGVAQDGSWGTKTSKALQKLIGTTVDGAFGAKSVKALQTYLNKQVFPSTGTSTIDKTIAWATKIANDNTWHYVTQNTTNVKTRRCPICNNYPVGKYHGWNCIRFVGAAYYHGGNAPIKVSQHTLTNNAVANTLLKSSASEALKQWTNRNGGSWQIITNGKKKIPASMLKKGDVLVAYNKEGASADYRHMALYIGNGYIIDSTSGSTGISKRKYSSMGSKTLLAFRYTGK